MEKNAQFLEALIRTPPSFCEYASGPCDQSFESELSTRGIFLYPSSPEIIANTIEEAARRTKVISGQPNWLTWKDFETTGQIIFCQICKAQRFTGLVVADVTTLNFNLLFEIGYALGLGLPVLPIRDSNFAKDKKLFDELGLLDTLGYLDFQNSQMLSDGIVAWQATPFVAQIPAANKEQPIYLMKSHIQNDGMVTLMSALKKSALRFRSFDPRETPRLSLLDAFKQVHSSLGVVAHLVAPERSGATVHNARCAFVSGMAMAAGKRVLMLQETDIQQPIDYRDVVRSYSNPSKIPDLLLPLIRGVVETLQQSRFVATALPLRLLEKVDLGDLAAENEITALGSYFVPTGQYNEAKRGHARLVVGRKGAGKTAIFYGVRRAYKTGRSHLVLDLKPEGHQFTKLREFVLKQLSPGLQQHVLTAFWNYLLLMEVAHKIIEEEKHFSYQESSRRAAYLRVVRAYGREDEGDEGDFSERLLGLVNDIVGRRDVVPSVLTTSQVTNLVYSQDIRPLSDALSDYLAISKKEDVWLLFDNLDKGWPVRAVSEEDILILKSLLEATRKLQRQFETRGVEFYSVVFVRNDIYEHLLLDPADRGKDTAVILDWSDPEVFKEILRRRIIQSTELDRPFEELWPLFFETHIKAEESFAYILSRTLLRPREVIRFCRECVDVAINRGHDKVTEGDILHAEKSHSEDSLVDITLELRDVSPQFAEVPYAFIEAKAVLSRDELAGRISEVGIGADQINVAIELLLWFGFIGIYLYPEEERYSYQFQHNLKRMQSGLSQGFSYCIHPAFRVALDCAD